MIRVFLLTACVVTSAMADEVRSNAKAEPKIKTAKVEKFSPSFVRWIESNRQLTSAKTSPSWISGDVGVRVLAIRR